MSGSFGLRWLFQPASTGGGPVDPPDPPPTPPAAPARVVTTMLWVNDTPLERYGLVLQRPERWLDHVTRPLPDTTRLQGMTGGRYDPMPAGTPRDVLLTGVLLNVPLEALQGRLAALADAFSGLLELRWPHAPTAVQRGVAGVGTVEPYVPEKAFVKPDAQCWRITIPIRCADGAVYQRQPTRVRLTTTPRALPLRGLPVGGEILLNGPLSGAVDIDLLSPTHVRLQRLALRNVTLNTGDVLSIRLDAPHLLVRRTAAGGAENVYSWRSLSLSTRWWKANPRHANAARGQRLFVRVSAGTGWWTFVNGDPS